MSHYDLDKDADAESALKRIRTTGTLSISPELFEKIYLTPKTPVAGDLRTTFGNPTPLALGGFLLSLSPLSCILMSWRGSGGNGISNIGIVIAFGGILTLLGSVGEWILGNTFISVVFGTFGAFFLSFAWTLQPFYGAYSYFATTGEPDSTGLMSPEFNASFGCFLIFMGLLCVCFLLCSTRTNVIFFLVFLLLVPVFGLLTAFFWYNAKAGQAAAAGNKAGTASYTASGENCVFAAGAVAFAIAILGWYIFFSIMLASVDFPLVLPVGDLSRFIKGASERAAARKSE